MNSVVGGRDYSKQHFTDLRRGTRHERGYARICRPGKDACRITGLRMAIGDHLPDSNDFSANTDGMRIIRIRLDCQSIDASAAASGAAGFSSAS